jgi:predicted Ser/Thr protein kinase
MGGDRIGAGVTPLERADPRKLGGYRLLGRLGAGGMGVVYLGRRKDVRVAIKVIRPELADDEHFRSRFRREVSAASRVRSVCTARVIASDPDGPRPYLVSEYVEGPTLRAAVEARGPLEPSAVRGLGVALAEAAHAMHEASVVHRDLTPNNVILARDGPKVIDFGIARDPDSATLTNTGAFLGTPAWMAPEQVLGEQITEATDIFGWGMTVAFAATGRFPFGGGSLEAVAYRVVHGDPDLTGLEPPLLGLVGAALSKPPSERPTAVEVFRALAGDESAAHVESSVRDMLDRTWVLDDATVSLAPTLAGALPRPARAARLSRRVIVTAAAIVGLLVLGVGVVARTSGRASEARPKRSIVASLAVLPNGEQWAFFRDGHDQLHRAVWRDRWQAPEPVPDMGRLGSAPTTGFNANPAFQQVHVFWRGDNAGDLWGALWNVMLRRWEGPRRDEPSSGPPPGSRLVSDPSLALWPDGSQHVYYKGSDDNLYATVWAGQWSVQGPLVDMGPRGSAPTALFDPERDEESVFWRGDGGALWRASKQAGETTWDAEKVPAGPRGSELASEPSAARWTTGRQDVFYRGVDDRLWRAVRDADGTWRGRHRIPGVGPLASAPAAAYNDAKGEVHVLWRGRDDDDLWWAYEDDGTWARPVRITQGDLSGS